MSNENALASIQSTAAAPFFTPEQLETIKRTVAKGATNDELNMFIHIAQQYQLDPFVKDLWFIKMGQQQPVIMTSRDGYLKIANRDPAFDGIVSDVVYANDRFGKTKDGVNHEYGVKDRGTIIGAYALVYRKDRGFPVYVFAPMKDYCKSNGTWRQYPHAMILKVAEAMALKRAFSISGLVTREEMEGGDAMPSAPVQQQKRPDPKNPAETIKQLWERYKIVCDGNEPHAKNAMMKIVNGKPSKDWSDEDVIALGVDILAREKAKREAAEGVIDAEMIDPNSDAPMFKPEQQHADYPATFDMFDDEAAAESGAA